MDSLSLLRRRSFLQRASGLAFGFTAFQALYDMRLIQSAMGQTADLNPFSDYKALVYLFLDGGNDANNLLVPNDATEFAAYLAARGSIALSNTPGAVNSNSLIPLSTAHTQGRSFGIHAACPELQSLFDAGDLAILANVGTLVEPLTKALYKGNGKKPLQIGSHNDQVVQWATSVSDKVSRTGWGGRCVDLLKAYSGTSAVSLSISAAGFNTWEVGKDVTQFQIGTASTGTGGGGAKTLRGFTSGTARANTIRDIVADGRISPSLNERDFAGMFHSAIEAGDQINAALAGISAADHAIINNYFDGTVAAPGPLRTPNATPDVATVRSLAGQVKTIARMIAARNATGSNAKSSSAGSAASTPIPVSSSSQQSLYRAASRNIKALTDTMTALGIADSVTVFTGSDFGRTYGSNDGGSDHGWGSHALIAGGAVQGGRIYGEMPELVLGGIHDIGGGRWLPTTSVDEYASTLARWFGVSDANLAAMLPNLYRFNRRDLGFMG